MTLCVLHIPTIGLRVTFKLPCCECHGIFRFIIVWPRLRFWRCMFWESEGVASLTTI